MQEALGCWHKFRPAETAREAMIVIISIHTILEAQGMYFNRYRTDFIKFVLHYKIKLHGNGLDCPTCVLVLLSVWILGHSNLDQGIYEITYA